MLINRNRGPTYVALGILSAMVYVSAACANETDYGPAVTTTTSAQISDDAALRLASARCERAAQCNLFGRERTFGSRADCVTFYRERTNDTLVDACPHGVDNGRLDKCLGVLGEEMCLEDLGPISSLPECDKTLCKR